MNSILITIKQSKKTKQKEMTKMVLLSFSSSCKTVINCAFNLKNPLFDQHNIKQRQEEENPPFFDRMLLHMIIGEANRRRPFSALHPP